ncbi:hypothetical protein CHARACLAT_011438, partial [Characodon lateralis]|nr:hypothetical protein [Characodon lateralis]
QMEVVSVTFDLSHWCSADLSRTAAHHPLHLLVRRRLPERSGSSCLEARRTIPAKTFHPRRHRPAARPAPPLPPHSTCSRPIRGGGGTTRIRTSLITRSSRLRWRWSPPTPEALSQRLASSDGPSNILRLTWTLCHCAATGKRTWT